MDIIINSVIAILVIALSSIFIYYLYKVAKSYGGEIRKAYLRLSIGTIFFIISVVIMGIIIRFDLLCGEITSAPIMFLALLPAIIGAILVLIGSRKLMVIIKV